MKYLWFLPVTTIFVSMFVVLYLTDPMAFFITLAGVFVAVLAALCMIKGLEAVYEEKET